MEDNSTQSSGPSQTQLDAWSQLARMPSQEAIAKLKQLPQAEIEAIMQGLKFLESTESTTLAIRLIQAYEAWPYSEWSLPEQLSAETSASDHTNLRPIVSDDLA